MNSHVDHELPALLGGELPPSVAAAVHAHLAGCDRCRLVVAAVAFAAGELRSAARLPWAVPSVVPRRGFVALHPDRRSRRYTLSSSPPDTQIHAR